MKEDSSTCTYPGLKRTHVRATPSLYFHFQVAISVPREASSASPRISERGEAMDNIINSSERLVTREDFGTASVRKCQGCD